MGLCSWSAAAVVLLGMPLSVGAQPFHGKAKLGEFKRYRSFDTDTRVEVERVQLGGAQKDQVLMRIRVGKEVGPVRLYLLRRSRKGHRLVLAGTESVKMSNHGKRTLFKGTWHEYSELWVKSKKVRVIYDRAASRATVAKDLFSSYLVSQRLTPRDTKEVRREIAATVAAIRKACGHTRFKATVAWADFKRRGLTQLAHASVNYLLPLAKLCADQDYRQRIRKLKRAHFAPAKATHQHHLKLTGSWFRVELAPHQPNNALLARKWLADTL